MVDGDAVIRFLFRHVIERDFAARGVRVVEGGTGEDAVALRFGTPTPALLVVSSALPGLSGQRAVSEIRRRERAEGLPRAPIVVEGAFGFPDAPVVSDVDASLEYRFVPQEIVAVVGALLAGVPG